VVDEVVGLGPIEPLLRDPTISEVMVNAPDEVYYERDGIICEAEATFRDEGHILRIIDRIVASIGRHVDEASPMVDARLADGSRVNVILPPLAPKSPVLTIRKFRDDRFNIEDLIRVGTLSEGMAEVLLACVRAKLNIVVSGGTGSGKTTMLNALSAAIPARERIVTIEDPIELRLQQRHVVPLEARPASTEGRGEVTQRDLVRNALRMRPDRIIVGEVRGPEAFDMMQAMNTGHEGSLTTVHANSPRDALGRIENMVLMAGFELPITAIREQMASALHVVIQLARHSDGRRRVVHLTEVAGLEGSLVTLQDIFTFKQRGIDADGMVIGNLQPTGIRPRFADIISTHGVTLGEELFNVGRWG
jgi:pilus assembly protein CpaF